MIPQTLRPLSSGSPVVWVLAIGLGLRLLPPLAALSLVDGGPSIHQPDSFGYVSVAQELVATGRFANQGKPELVRTPGYPLLLVPGALWGRVNLVAVVLQVGLSCLTVWLVHRTALEVFRRRNVALCAALIFALEPLSALYASILLTETLFTCLVAVFALFLVRYTRSAARRDLALSALALAASIYVRPIAYFLPLLVGLSLAVGTWRASRKRALGHAAAFVLVAMGLAGVWQARNYLLTGYQGMAAISEINLYFYQAAAVLAAEQDKQWTTVQHELGYNDEPSYLGRHPEQRRWPEAKRYDFLRQEAIRIMRANPGETLRLHWEGMRSTLLDVGTQAWLDYFRAGTADDAEAGPGHRGAWARIARFVGSPDPRLPVVALHAGLRAALAGILLLALVGLASAGAWKQWPVILLVVVTAYFVFMSGGPVGYHRFRLPIVPILSLLGGNGLVAVGAVSRRLIGIGRRRSAGSGK